MLYMPGVMLPAGTLAKRLHNLTSFISFNCTVPFHNCEISSNATLSGRCHLTEEEKMKSPDGK